MLKKIEKERKRAEHLFYTSLKYTKTADVMVNLMKRWASTIEETIEASLKHAKKKKLIKEIPKVPKAKIIVMKKIIKEDVVKKMMDLYEIFRNINKYRKVAEHEFRKNVSLKLIKDNQVIKIDLTKLEEWEKIFEDYIKIVTKFLRSK